MADEPLPGSYDSDTLSKVYVDGLELEALVQALEDNQRLIGSQKSVSERQFWSTPRRHSTDTTREVYEVSLNAARKVNFLTFDLARFPQHWHIFYRSGSSGAWKPLLAKNKRAIIGHISDSIPAVLTPPPPGSTEHPQHYGAGHWVRKSYDLHPVTARQFRLVIHREPSKKAPVDRAKKKVSYSLGVRAFEVGYKVKGRDDVPATKRSPVVVTEREAFASTTDILGSPVAISVRENRAGDLLKGSMWRSEPQPIPNAVVNLYVDARDGNGLAQVIDRFYLEPTTSGASMNVYYSNDTPDQMAFSASDNPLDFPLTRANGGATISSTGLVFPDAFGYVDLDNAGAQFNPLRPFWLGMTLHPSFGADSVVPHPLLDTGTLRVEWKNSALVVAFAGTTAVYSRPGFAEGEDENAPTVIPPMFLEGDQVSFVVGYDGADLVIYVDGQTLRTPITNPVLMKQPKTVTGITSYLRFGGYSVPDNADPGHGDFRLTSFILKSETPATPETFESYFADPTSFVDGTEDEDVEQTEDTSDNALVRYLPLYQTPGAGSLNPLGFIGGPGSRYEDLVWTPINRDFRLAKGYVVFNPTKAKYFKFEFTNLVAQPYDEYAPVTRKVKVFPTAQVYRQAVVTSSNNTVRGAITAVNAASSTLFFADQARLYSISRPMQPAASYIPTVGVYSSDPKIAENLRHKSLYLNLQAWHSRTFTPRFVDVQKHIYETVEVQHTQRVAYFVGLSRIEMSRVDYITDDDTDQYLEPFSDAANLVVDEEGELLGGWGLDGGWLATPGDLGVSSMVTTTSKIFASRRKVTAIQFATQQTPPVQILPDADMEDPILTNWRGVGDATATPSDEFATDIGTMVQVRRDSTANFWAVIEDRYPSWDAIEGLNLEWDDLELSGTVNPMGGLAAASAYAVSAEGRLYAAARVYAPDDLSAPLYVQIVDEVGKVLSEEQVDVKAGQVAEWYTAYTIGEGGETLSLDWDGVEALGTWDALEAIGNWSQIAQVTLEHVGRVSARIVQTEPTMDHWYVDNISLFDDAIVWEFSRDGGTTFYPVYDIRNDPRGVFVFPPSDDSEAGLGLVWRVKGTRPNQRVDYLALRPWYDSLPMGQPHRETIQVTGPNQALIDHFPPVTEDPRWKVWNKPIPEEWWFVFRQWLLEQRPEPGDLSTIVVPSSIVPVDEGSPDDPYVVGDVVNLYSAIMSVHPNEADLYPFAPTSTAILEDGTYFVATQLDRNNFVAATGPKSSHTIEENLYNAGVVRMWHLDTDLSVLGVHDQTWEGIVRVGGDPGPYAFPVPGNKAVLVFESAYDSDNSGSGSASNRLVDTGTEYTPTPTDPTATIYGTGLTLAYFYDPQISTMARVEIIAPNTTAMAATLLTSTFVRSDLVMRELLLRAYVRTSDAVLANVRWKLADSRLPYGSDVLLSATGLNRTRLLVQGEWTLLEFRPTLSEAQLAVIKEAVTADAAILAMTPGSTGVREISGLSITFKYGHDL